MDKGMTQDLRHAHIVWSDARQKSSVLLERMTLTIMVTSETLRMPSVFMSPAS